MSRKTKTEQTEKKPRVRHVFGRLRKSVGGSLWTVWMTRDGVCARKYHKRAVATVPFEDVVKECKVLVGTRLVKLRLCERGVLVKVDGREERLVTLAELAEEKLPQFELFPSRPALVLEGG